MSSRNATRRDAAWSLAGRLTLWYAAASFVTVAAFTCCLYLAMVYTLEAEDDQFMAEKVEIVRILLRDRTQAAGGVEEGNTPPLIYLRVVSAEGKVLLVTPGMDASLPADLFPPVQESGPIQGLEQHLPDGRTFRLASVSPGPNYPRGACVQVAMDRTREEQLFALYRWSLAALLLVALLGCTILGYRIARHGLRPVVTIADTASHIGSSTLNERIDSTSLPRELLSLADTFNAMLDRLEGSFARLRQFSADIAHELRTPVNNMRGEIEVALGKPRAAEEYREVLGSSLEECGRLAAMIDSMLFLARAEAPEPLLTREPVDVVKELRTVCDFYEAAAGEAGVQLTVVSEGTLTTALDRPLFQRAVANLVSNALKHTPPGGAVQLAARSEPGGIRVEVTDTGSGIPTEHQPHVFERFYRVDHARSSPGGVGLGLAIVRRVVELHGGSVELASEPGRGTRFVMHFSDSPSSVG